jgi:hypothetical protein
VICVPITILYVVELVVKGETAASCKCLCQVLNSTVLWNSPGGIYSGLLHGHKFINPLHILKTMWYFPAQVSNMLLKYRAKIYQFSSKIITHLV